MADKPLETDVIPLDGKLNTADDPISIGKNFRTLKNMRYAGDHLQGIGGMTKINSSIPTSFFKPRAGHHFQKHQPAESHILEQAYNSGLSASRVIDNTAVPPSAGNFSATSLFTDGSGAGRGRFSDAPGGSVAYANGVEACLWGGDEMRCARFINFSPDGSFSYDYTDQVTNTLTSTSNLATLHSAPVGNDSSVVLLIHFDNAVSFVDSSATSHAITKNGNPETGGSGAKIGGGCGHFDGTGDYASIADHANFDFSGGIWTVDFWVYPTTTPSGQYIYSQYTDANNYMGISVIAGSASSTFGVSLVVQAAGAPVVSLSAGSASINAWHHVEVSENGDNYYIFIDGVLIASAVDTDRPANYTNVVMVGGSAGFATTSLTGNLDELRVSKGVCRHTSNFVTETLPYGSAGHTYMYIGATRPLQGFKFYVGTANTTTNTLRADYWSGSEWLSLTNIADNTSSGGKSLAQTGTVTFSAQATQVDNEVVKSINKVVLYWYRVALEGGSSATTTLSYITVNAPLQGVRDIWDGTMRKVLSFQKFSASTFNDNTVNVFDDTYDSANTATFAELDGLVTSTQYIVAGFIEQMMGVEFHLIGGHVNTTASTTLTVKYWNGTAWTAITSDDGTVEGGISFAKSGTVTWNPPSLVTEFKREVSKTAPLYYYRFEFDKTLSADVQLFYVGGIPAPKPILGYAFPMLADNRQLFLRENAKDKNKALCSAEGAPDVYNGEDSTEIFFGDERGLTGGAWVFNRVGSDFRSVKLFFKANETWVVDGDLITGKKYQLSDKVGCIAPHTIATVTIGADLSGGQGALQVAIWQGAKGVYLCDTQSIIPIHWDIRNLFDERASDKINVTYSKESAGFIDAEKMEYHWLIATGAATTMNREFVYDILRKKWYEIARGTGKELQIGIPVKDADGNNYIYGTIETGYMERLENGTDFDGTAIAHEFQTGDITFAGMMEETEIRKVKLLQAAKSTTTNEATITHYADTKTTGTALSTYDPTATGKRVADVAKGANQKGVFHAFKGTMSTSDETIGWEPIALGLFFKDVRKDTN